MPASPFRHGVASFEPTTTSILLWTRTATPGEVRWRIGRDAALVDIVTAGTTTATEDADRTVTVEAADLEPASTYFYDFEIDGHRSPVGRTRTLPDGRVDRFRIGLTCCADHAVAPLGVYRALAEREVDVVVHLGDYIYAAQTAHWGRRGNVTATACDLDGYRCRYEQLRADPDVQYLHARHPMVTIWDDHDLADNAWHTGAKHHDPAVHGPWDDRVAAATRARSEWLPLRYPEPGNRRRTWRSTTVGDLVELVLLDTRYEGRDRQAGDDGTPPRDDPDRSLLGDDQRAFVGDRLADTSRPWTIVASGVVVNEISLPLPAGSHLPTGLLPNGYAVLDGAVVHDDQWDGYTAERDLLIERIEARAGDGARTVLVSGDVHSCWAFEGPAGSDGEPVAVEAVCPAASSAAMGQANLPGINRLLDHAVRRMPQVQWADVTERGYVLCDVTRDDVRLEWWIVDPYALDPGGRAECAAIRRLRHETWPCRLDLVDEPSQDPTRPPLPDVPDRPDDLRSLRTQRVARLALKAMAGVLAGAGGVGAAISRSGHRRRRCAASGRRA